MKQEKHQRRERRERGGETSVKGNRMGPPSVISACSAVNQERWPVRRRLRAQTPRANSSVQEGLPRRSIPTDTAQAECLRLLIAKAPNISKTAEAGSGTAAGQPWR